MIDLNQKCTLLQGDCLEVMKEIPDESIDLVLTDPPYNIAFKPQRGTFDEIMNDNMSWQDFDKFMQPIINETYRVLKPNSVAFFFTGFSSSSSAFYQYLIKSGYQVKCQLVWVKNNFGIGYYFRPQHEDIWACFKGKPPLPKKAISSVIFESKVNFAVHSCEKPVNLLKHLILPFSKENQIILDCFMGSGSCGIAALQLNRKFIGIELDNQYFKLASERIKPHLQQKRLFE